MLETLAQSLTPHEIAMKTVWQVNIAFPALFHAVS
jgi:hypothetical protein